ncbi:MAG: choice-of-anchor J domain-containing protein [Phycisphaerales bacterium]
MKKFAALAVLAAAGSANAQSFFEGFNTTVASPVPAGWASVNNSPGGPGLNPNWQQGPNAAVFAPFEGTGYAFSNFNSSTGANAISNYMMSPVRTFTAGDTISFWTRTVSAPSFPDRLRLRISLNGASTTPADFATILLTVNPNLTTTGYPSNWTQFNAVLASGGSGRFAFHYDVPNGGPSGLNSDFIGVDAVQYTAVPAPGAAAVLGLGALVGARRRRA